MSIRCPAAGKLEGRDREPVGHSAGPVAREMQCACFGWCDGTDFRSVFSEVASFLLLNPHGEWGKLVVCLGFQFGRTFSDVSWLARWVIRHAGSQLSKGIDVSGTCFSDRVSEMRRGILGSVTRIGVGLGLLCTLMSDSTV